MLKKVHTLSPLRRDRSAWMVINMSCGTGHWVDFLTQFAQSVTWTRLWREWSLVWSYPLCCVWQQLAGVWRPWPSSFHTLFSVFSPPEGNDIMRHTEPAPHIYQQKVWVIMVFANQMSFASVKVLELEYFGYSSSVWYCIVSFTFSSKLCRI